MHSCREASTRIPPALPTGAQGRERVEAVRGELATPAAVEPWDGQAGKLELEEEFSLEDLMGDNDEL